MKHKFKVTVQQIIDIETDAKENVMDLVKAELYGHPPYTDCSVWTTAYFVDMKTRNEIKIISIEEVGNQSNK